MLFVKYMRDMSRRVLIWWRLQRTYLITLVISSELCGRYLEERPDGLILLEIKSTDKFVGQQIPAHTSKLM